MATDREREQSREAEALTVGPLLARANLLRMRRQWDEAIAVCTEALRKAPDSATAHSLLGDIYEAQGRIDDAIQWFGMAVEIDPDNAVDRVKLERLTQVQQARLKAAEAKAPPAAPREKPKEKTIERTVEWFDRAFPPGKSESIARLLFAVSGGLALALAAGFVYVFYFLPRNGGPQLLPTLTAPGARPMPTTVAPRPGIVAARPAAPPAVTNAPASAPTPRAPGAGAATPNPADGALRDALARAATGLFTVTEARAEAATGHATLDIALTTVGDSFDKAREQVVRAAAQAARAAAAADPRLKSVSVRVAILGGVSAANPTAAPASATVFRGDLAPAALGGIDPMTAGLADLVARFNSLQWFPPFSPAVGAAPPTPAPPANPGAPVGGGLTAPPAPGAPPASEPTPAALTP